MFKIIFGSLWLAITSFAGFAVITAMNNEESTTVMLFPLIFVLVFVAIGVVFILSGLKQLRKDAKTKKYGVDTYAIITDIQHTGSYMNGRPELKAIMSVIDNNFGGVNAYEEIIGFKYAQYMIGDFLLVKHYEDDVNIIKKIPEDQVPYDKKDILLCNTKITMSTDANLDIGESRKTIIIDGKEYVEK